VQAEGRATVQAVNTTCTYGACGCEGPFPSQGSMPELQEQPSQQASHMYASHLRLHAKARVLEVGGPCLARDARVQEVAGCAPGAAMAAESTHRFKRLERSPHMQRTQAWAQATGAAKGQAISSQQAQ
jgi:hypothetical protein